MVIQGVKGMGPPRHRHTAARASTGEVVISGGSKTPYVYKPSKGPCESVDYVDEILLVSSCLTRWEVLSPEVDSCNAQACDNGITCKSSCLSFSHNNDGIIMYVIFFLLVVSDDRVNYLFGIDVRKPILPMRSIQTFNVVRKKWESPTSIGFNTSPRRFSACTSVGDVVICTGGLDRGSGVGTESLIKDMMVMSTRELQRKRQRQLQRVMLYLNPLGQVVHSSIAIYQGTQTLASSWCIPVTTFAAMRK